MKRWGKFGLSGKDRARKGTILEIIRGGRVKGGRMHVRDEQNIL